LQTDCTSAFVSQTFLARAGGAVAPVNCFLSSTLITMQNLVTVSHTKCTHADPKIWGMLWPHPLGLGVAGPRNMPLPMCNHVKFGCSMSNDKSIHIRRSARENGALMSHFSRSLESTQINQQPMTSC